MPPTLPSPSGRFVIRGTYVVLAAWIAFTAACGTTPPPVAPGPPIPPPAELTLDSMDVECNGLITALATYAQCPNLHEDDRWDLDAWSERAQQDFAAGKKAAPEPNAQHAIAAACRKAAVSVQAATERCHAGPALPAET